MVLSQISDHSLVSITLSVPPLTAASHRRLLWDFPAAQWPALRLRLAREDWRWIERSDPLWAAAELTKLILLRRSTFLVA
eukprot:7675420-Alexandrium_andersonii.AAC.1